MKKLVLTSLCTLAVAGAAIAQGNVNWQTVSFTAMTAQTNAITYSPIAELGAGAASGLAGATQGATAGAALGTYYYALLYNGVSVPTSGVGVAKPTTLAGLAAWQDSGLRATNSGTAGRLATVTPTAAATVPWAVGTTQNVMLVGWSANLGTTWAAALGKLNNWAGDYVANAYFGMSNTGYIAPTGANPGAAIFGTSATAQGLPIFSLNTQLNLLAPVPEPSTLALAGLGGLALLALRRRK